MLLCPHHMALRKAHKSQIAMQLPTGTADHLAFQVSLTRCTLRAALIACLQVAHSQYGIAICSVWTCLFIVGALERVRHRHWLRDQVVKKNSEPEGSLPFNCASSVSALPNKRRQPSSSCWLSSFSGGHEVPTPEQIFSVVVLAASKVRGVKQRP